MKKTTSYAHLTFKSLRGAAIVAGRAIRSGVNFRDVRRRMVGRIREMMILNRGLAKALTEKILAKAIFRGQKRGMEVPLTPSAMIRLDLSVAATRRRRAELVTVFQTERAQQELFCSQLN